MGDLRRCRPSEILTYDVVYAPVFLRTLALHLTQF